jgi:uncharacterized protein
LRGTHRHRAGEADRRREWPLRSTNDNGLPKPEAPEVIADGPWLQLERDGEVSAMNHEVLSLEDTTPTDRQRVLGRWREYALSVAPAARDRKLIVGLEGEYYYFDTCTGIFVQLWGPAVTLMKVLCAEPADVADRIAEAGATYSGADLAEAMEQCTAILQAVREARRPPVPPQQARRGYNLSLNAGMACNLSCTYCDPLGYREKTRGQVMSEETAYRALDFFFQRIPAEEVGVVTFSIGGEPLLYRKLLDLVTAYTEALREQGVQATQYLNTNGLLLTDGVIEYLRVKEIPFGISMDGPREVHDAQRRLPDGEGTYDAVRRGADRVLGQFPHTTVSAVVTAAFPYPLRIYQHLLELGFRRIIVKPVRGRPDQPFAFTMENYGRLRDGYREYARYLADELVAGRREIYAAINPYDSFGSNFLRVFERKKTHYRCGAASLANLAVAPDGSFYPCEGFVGHTDYRLGDVETGFDESAMARFANLYADNRPICQDCWARYLCGGGCYLRGLIVNGDVAQFDPVECEMVRCLVELAVWALGYIEMRRPEALVDLQEWCATKGWHGSAAFTSARPTAESGLFELPMVG